MKTNYFTSAAMAIAMFTISSAAMADNVQTAQNKQESQTAEVEAEAQPQPESQVEAVAAPAPRATMRKSAFDGTDNLIGPRFGSHLDIKEPRSSRRPDMSDFRNTCPGRIEAGSRHER